MVNSTLLQLLSTLSLAEFKDFGEYIRSSYFNKNESVIKLYDHLKLYHPDFSVMNFEKGSVYKKLFPNIDYDDAFMRKLMFNLSKLAEDYIAYNHFTKNKFEYNNCLLKEFESRDLEKLFLKKLNSMEDEFGKLKIKDTEYYETKNKIDAFREYIILKSSSFVNTKDKPGEILVREIESLIDFFLIRIIDKYRFFFNFKKMLNYEFESEPEFYKRIITYLKKNESLHNVPLLSLYFNSLLLIIERDESYFEKVKEILISEMDTLNYSDKYSSFAVLINFANDEYYKGKKKYLKERHELHKLVLENNLISEVREGEFFNEMLFKNIVTVGLLLKETEWTEEFIKNNIEKVYPEQRDNVLNLINARLNFEKKNYEKSLEDLSKISSVHHFHYKPSIKMLTLMIYIEKGWLAEALDVIDTYKHFLSNDKMLPDFQKEKNLNFIRFCREILKLKSKYSKEKISGLKYDLMNTENVLEREWLHKVIEELEK